MMICHVAFPGVCVCVVGAGGGGTLTFACYIGSLPTLIFNQKKYQRFLAYPKTTKTKLQPKMVTKISNQTVEFILYLN